MFIVHRIVFSFNIIAILGLLGSFLAPFITPELSWQVAFLGLAYPAILVLNILFIVYWAVFLKLRFMFSLAAIVIGWNYIPRFIQFEAKKAPQNIEKGVQVMTFNMRYFDLWEPEKVTKEEEEEFFEKLEKVNPDILCLQEFIAGSATDDPLVNRFISKFSRFNRANVRVSGGRWAADNMAILSRYPIIGNGIVEHDPSSGNYTVYADIRIDKDTIRTICTHLQSIRFEKKQYKAVENLTKEIDSIEISQYKKIASKMKLAFLMRSKQADAIRDFVAESPYKVILCGDFNDSPTSYAYRTISNELKDAFMEAGSGLGRTYVGPMPSLRIDYILGDPSFTFYNYYAKSFGFSDHKMVTCTIQLSKSDDHSIRD